MCRFTIVCGPAGDDALKDEFLQEIRMLCIICLGPWCVAGDFHLILDAEDKSIGRLNHRLMTKFRQVVNDLELAEAQHIDR